MVHSSPLTTNSSTSNSHQEIVLYIYRMSPFSPTPPAIFTAFSRVTWSTHGVCLQISVFCVFFDRCFYNAVASGVCPWRVCPYRWRFLCGCFCWRGMAYPDCLGDSSLIFCMFCNSNTVYPYGFTLPSNTHLPVSPKVIIYHLYLGTN